MNPEICKHFTDTSIMSGVIEYTVPGGERFRAVADGMGHTFRARSWYVYRHEGGAFVLQRLIRLPRGRRATPRAIHALLTA